MAAVSEHGDGTRPRAVEPALRQAGHWAVEAHGLTKRFGPRIAVDNVDLLVPRGCAFGYLGPNGAGKTTLIRVLLGLTRADSGTMSLLGVPIPGQRRRALAWVGAIVDEPRFHSHLTGRENLKILAAARGAGRRDPGRTRWRRLTAPAAHAHLGDDHRHRRLDHRLVGHRRLEDDHPRRLIGNVTELLHPGPRKGNASDDNRDGNRHAYLRSLRRRTEVSSRSTTSPPRPSSRVRCTGVTAGPRQKPRERR
jgi:energy-coupling factor transporter ATP-binding protein EcfA2